MDEKERDRKALRERVDQLEEDSEAIERISRRRGDDRGANIAGAVRRTVRELREHVEEVAPEKR